MTDTADQQAVTVAQEDREAAHAIRFQQLGYTVKMGDEHSLVQAFARHRLASVSSASAEIPAGMKPWTGGDSAPGDWDGGPVLWRNGRIGASPAVPAWEQWCRRTDPDGRDIMAYTPEPVPATNQAGEVAKALFDHEMRQRGVVAFWDDVDEDDRAGWQLSVNVVLAAALATQPATSQEGEAVDRVAKAIYETGGSFADQHGSIAWADLDGSNDAENFRKMARAALAATPTPPTLSEDLREAAIAAVLNAARFEGADSPVDYGDAEQIVDAVLATLAQVKAS